jgi:hypothetical protein
MFMRRILNLLGAACFCLAGSPAHAAHTQARLILAADSARPGDTVLAGVQLRMDPRWHTYWRNPGASGMATKIEWELPTGVTVGAIQWPVPEKLWDDDLTTYVYSNEVVLLVPLKLAQVEPGPLSLRPKSRLSATCTFQRSQRERINVGTEPTVEGRRHASSLETKFPGGNGLFAPWWKPAMGTSFPGAGMELQRGPAKWTFPMPVRTSVQPATEIPADRAESACGRR